ncbi:MAG: hypothetical protein MUF16_02310 [Burkholderiaceae bacterium]|nr:hypothetical protein [Burkholderiaceae bacterium]
MTFSCEPLKSRVPVKLVSTSSTDGGDAAPAGLMPCAGKRRPSQAPVTCEAVLSVITSSRPSPDARTKTGLFACSGVKVAVAALMATSSRAKGSVAA